MRKRAATTILEVLIVIAIVGVLSALLLPIVQRARESAARSSCRNNLRQIALGAQAYDSTHGSLPPGYLGNLPTSINAQHPAFWKAQWVGSLAFLLPHLGHDEVYLRFNLKLGLDVTDHHWLDDSQMITAAESKIPTFLCPWDDAYSNRRSTIASIGFFEEGGRLATICRNASIPGPGERLGRTNYLGVAGRSARITNSAQNALEGVFFNRSKVSLAEVAQQDGTSNVLMFGESISDASPVTRENAFSWMGAGCLPSRGGISSPAPFPLCFSSAHLDVVQFALCDASVRSLKKNTKLEHFINLSAYHDGDPNGSNFLGE